jgi:hypothetical protein
MGIIGYEFASGDGSQDPFGGTGTSFERPGLVHMPQLQEEILTAAGRNSLQSAMYGDLIWVAPRSQGAPLTQTEKRKIRLVIRRHDPDLNWGKSEHALQYEALIAKLQDGADLTFEEISTVLRWQTRHGINYS